VSDHLQKMSITARRAAQAKNWPQVKACAREILSRSRDSAEGYFLLGLAESASQQRESAEKALTRALQLDERRYDAAVELAGLKMRANRYGEAVALLEKHSANMQGSPKYLDMAGSIYVNAGQPENAWPLYQRANELQPGVHSLMANFAACSVYVGKIDEAKQIYRNCLQKFPQHQRHHYELSRLSTAKDPAHIDEMQAILQSSQLSPEKNVYLYYALGKELEDLERWDEAFTYIEKAGKAALSVSDYDVGIDVELIDKMIEVCSPDWLADGAAGPSMDNKTPIFIVGLPRTGTTLTERILSCHSMVESVGESYFIQIAIKEASRVSSQEHMTAAMVEAAASKDIQRIAKSYTNAIKYRFGNKPFYIEKFPENFLYLGFIAKAFPNAKIIHLNRNPMDSCFAMFKQSFFRYAYSLDDLGPYYLAYHRLHKHWNELLGEQLIEVHYEELVSDQEDTTRRLLAALGLDFEEACLHFEDNVNASNTASTVQIRQKIHTRSVNRWKCFEKQLQSLKRYLEDAGIPLSEEQSGRVN
jgi:tetratricopeptide (TPR) repeat protein